MQKLILIALFITLSTNSYGRPIIIGGEKPKLDSPIVSSTVSLQAEMGGVMRSFCSGTVIGPKIVLTAAHCIAELGEKDFSGDLASIYIASGINSYEGKRVRVEGFKYNYSEYFKLSREGSGIGDKDIAILITEVELTGLTPVKLGDPSLLNSESNLLLAGYGVTSVEDEDSTEDLPQDATGILYFLSGRFFVGLENSKVTIQEKSKKRTASGDSGGPIYVKVEDDLVVHGVLSNGGEIFEETSNRIMNPIGHESEYTHPAFYVDWMNCALPQNLQVEANFTSSVPQRPCDGVGVQKFEKLIEFNRNQCESQLPGFSMVEDYGCFPVTEVACKRYLDTTGDPVSWDLENQECVRKLD